MKTRTIPASTPPTTEMKTNTSIGSRLHAQQGGDARGHDSHEEGHDHGQQQGGLEVLAQHAALAQRELEGADVHGRPQSASPAPRRCSPSCRWPEGSGIIRPASALSVSVIEPRVAPASRSPTEEIMSATKPRVNTFRLREKNPRTCGDGVHQASRNGVEIKPILL